MILILVQIVIWCQVYEDKANLIILNPHCCRKLQSIRNTLVNGKLSNYCHDESNTKMEGWILYHVMRITVPFSIRMLFITHFITVFIFIGCHTLHIWNINKDNLLASSWQVASSGPGFFFSVSLTWEVCMDSGCKHFSTQVKRSLAFFSKQVHFCISLKVLCPLWMTLTVARPVSVSSQAGRQAGLQWGCSSWLRPRHRNAVCAV